MAIVGKIRDKSLLIVIVVGLGLLLFIIPFDQFYRFFSGTGEQPVGQLYGEDIYPSEFAGYNRIVNVNARSVEQRINQESQNWSQYMLDTVMKTEINKVGLQVSTEEFKDVCIFGNGVPAALQNLVRYPDPNNPRESLPFEQDSLIKLYNNLVNQLENAVDAQQKQQVEANMTYIRTIAIEGRLKEKYIAMSRFSTVASPDESKKFAIANGTNKSVKYVIGNLDAIDDEEIEISESALKAKFEKEKSWAKWKRDSEYLSFDYVAFDVVASEADKENVIAKLENLKSNFANFKDTEGFINTHSDIKPELAYIFPVIQENFEGDANQLSNEFITEINAAATGTVVGPSVVKANGREYQAIAKITGSGASTTDQFSYFILNGPQTAKADSIVELLTNDASAQMGMTALSMTNGALLDGEATEISNGLFPADVNSWVINAQVGAYGKVETASQGTYIVKKTADNIDQKSVAFVLKDVQVSDQTELDTYADKGLAFMDAAKADGMAAAAEAFEVEIQDNPGNMELRYPLNNVFGYDEGFTFWAFDPETKSGDVSQPIKKNGKIYVARLKTKGSENVPTFEGIKEDLRKELILEAKINMLAEKAAGAGSVEAISEAFGNPDVGVQTMDIALSSESLPNGPSYDPIAIGQIFSLTEGEVAVIKGEYGVYGVVVEGTTAATLPEDMTATQLKATESIQASSGFQPIAEALLRSANMKDWRYKAKLMENKNRK